MNNHRERVLVTGGSGFIGLNLIDELRCEGADILNVDIVRPKIESHLPFWRMVDLRDGQNLISTVLDFKPTKVFHLGAKTDLKSTKIEDYSANTEGVVNLIAACNKVGTVSRVIFTSSRLVCTIGYIPKSDRDYCPSTVYGESKVIGEEVLKTMGECAFEWLIVRPTSIWGPWFNEPYRVFFDQIESRRYVNPGAIRVYKSFGFVGNSVFQLKRLMDARREDVQGGVYYLGDYIPIELQDFSFRIAEALQVPHPWRVPEFVLLAAAKFGDVLHGVGMDKFPLTSFRLNNLRTQMVHDFGGLPSITGDLPFTIDEGIAVTVDWMRRTAKS